MKRIAIVVLDWNGADDTIECLSCLNNFLLYDIYLLDNASSKENIQRVTDYLQSRFKNELSIIHDKSFTKDIESRVINYILSSENLGFAVGNNFVVSKIVEKYQFVLLLNNDTVVPDGTIEHLFQTACEQDTVALTCDIRLYYNTEELWNAGGIFAFYGDRKYFSQNHIDNLRLRGVKYINAEFITGCALLIQTAYIKKYGLFTDSFFHGEDDFNFCYKLKKNNQKVGVDLAVTLYHKVGRSIQRVSSNDKNYSKMLVHFANRVIDFKEFYSKPKWLAWRNMYLFLLFVRKITTGMPVKIAWLLIKRIKSVSDQNDQVKKPLFDKLMGLTWDV